MQVDSLMKELLFTTIHIRCNTAAGSTSGTAFIFNAAEGDQPETTPVLVTNRHVVEGAHGGAIRLLGRQGDTVELGNPIEAVYSDFTGMWIGHPDPAVDVSAAFLGPTLNTIVAQGRAPFFKIVSAGLCPTEEDIDGFDAVEVVTFIGYPNGLYDTVNHTPIVRRGITATPIALDWNGTPAFLIDASVFPGSSGSPVFLVQDGIVRRGNNLSIGGPSKVHLLGVVSAVMLQPDTGQLVVANEPKVQFRQFIDLGVVFKARAVQETVDELCRVYGVDRSSVSGTVPPEAPDLPATVESPSPSDS